MKEKLRSATLQKPDIVFMQKFSWQTLIDSGKFSNVHELARAIGKDDGYVSRIIRLTLLSPEIIHAIIAGTLEKDIGIEQLKQAMPLMWDDQKKMFGME